MQHPFESFYNKWGIKKSFSWKRIVLLLSLFCLTKYSVYMIGMTYVFLI